MQILSLIDLFVLPRKESQSRKIGLFSITVVLNFIVDHCVTFLRHDNQHEKRGENRHRSFHHLRSPATGNRSSFNYVDDQTILIIFIINLLPYQKESDELSLGNHHNSGGRGVYHSISDPQGKGQCTIASAVQTR